MGRGKQAKVTANFRRAASGSAFETCPWTGKSVPAVLFESHCAALREQHGEPPQQGKEGAEVVVVVDEAERRLQALKREQERQRQREAAEAAAKAAEKAAKLKAQQERKAAAEEKKRKREAGEEEEKKKPKRPQSAYFLFAADFRAELKERDPEAAKSVTEVTKAAGAKWKEMTDEEKEPYVKRAAEAKAEFEAEHGPSTKAAAKEAKAKESGKPKRPQGAYFLFAADFRVEFKQNNPEAKITEVGKAAGAKWKEMTDEEKAPYAQKAAELKAEYEAKYGPLTKGKGKAEGQSENDPAAANPEATVAAMEEDEPAAEEVEPTEEDEPAAAE